MTVRSSTIRRIPRWRLFSTALDRKAWAWVAFVLLLAVAAVDYLTGDELELSMFYLVSICMTTWHRGWKLGTAVALSSVALEVTGDLVMGTGAGSTSSAWGNAALLLVFFGAFVRALHLLKTTHLRLHARVEERAVELSRGLAVQQKLQNALLEASEREQRRIGYDIHDSLCQHFTGAAMASAVLGEKLRAKGLSEAGDAEQVAGIVEDGIGLARSLAHGLAPSDLDGVTLILRLRELAETTALRARIDCSFELQGKIELGSGEVAMHLYRIAQEAVQNALRHGEAKSIRIRLAQCSDGCVLQISDSGLGISLDRVSSTGIGLQIMRHRADQVRGRFEIHPLDPGTRVSVFIPRADAADGDLKREF